jgi:hypothetical protein
MREIFGEKFLSRDREDACNQAHIRHGYTKDALSCVETILLFKAQVIEESFGTIECRRG